MRGKTVEELLGCKEEGRMKLQVTLVKSPVSSKPNHIKIVKALGLHKIRSTGV